MTIQLDIFEPIYHLQLTAEELSAFRRVIEDQSGESWGGHQLLAAKLQAREQGGELDVTGKELASAFMKAYGYGNGTWEKYFRAVIIAAKRVGWMPTADSLEAVRSHRAEVLSRHD